MTCVRLSNVLEGVAAFVIFAIDSQRGSCCMHKSARVVCSLDIEKS